ncbi:MAG: hypothetical protein V1820_02460 [archaeon]
MADSSYLALIREAAERKGLVLGASFFEGKRERTPPTMDGNLSIIIPQFYRTDGGIASRGDCLELACWVVANYGGWGVVGSDGRLFEKHVFPIFPKTKSPEPPARKPQDWLLADVGLGYYGELSGSGYSISGDAVLERYTCERHRDLALSPGEKIPLLLKDESLYELGNRDGALVTTVRRVGASIPVTNFPPELAEAEEYLKTISEPIELALR